MSVYQALSSFSLMSTHHHIASHCNYERGKQCECWSRISFFTLNKNKTMKLKYSKSHQNYSEFSRSNSKKMVLGLGQGSGLDVGIGRVFLARERRFMKTWESWKEKREMLSFYLLRCCLLGNKERQSDKALDKMVKRIIGRT